MPGRQPKKNFFSVIIALLSFATLAQEDCKKCVILLDMQEGKDQITFKNNAYLLTFNKNDLSSRYTGTYDHSRILTSLERNDTLALDQFFIEIGEGLGRPQDYTGMMSFIRELLIAGQAIISYEEKLIRKIVLHKKKRKRVLTTFDSFKNPRNGDVVYYYHSPYVSCPNF